MVGTVKQSDDGIWYIEYLKKERLGKNIKITKYPISKQQLNIVVENELWEQKVKFDVKRLVGILDISEVAHIYIPHRLYTLSEINQYTEYIKTHQIITFTEFTKL